MFPPVEDQPTTEASLFLESHCGASARAGAPPVMIICFYYILYNHVLLSDDDSR